MAQMGIINDISTLTRVPNKVLQELVNKEILCIGSIIHDAILTHEDVVTINIGIGTLSVEIATKQCKFLPSKELKNTIKKSIDGKVDPLELYLDQAIVDKLSAICDEVL